MIIVHDSDLMYVKFKKIKDIHYLIFEINENYSDKLSDDLYNKFVNDINKIYVYI